MEPLRERNQINQSVNRQVGSATERDVPLEPLRERNQINQSVNPMVGSAYQADPIQINHSAPLPTLHLHQLLL
ncbi:hypothetical protein [Moorena producens]|uniref:hypothetical protein n=1 Tax=Moorena producens TaxID=1155739 RepID=UPI003C73AEC5